MSARVLALAIATTVLAHAAAGQALDRARRPVAPPAPVFHFPKQYSQTLPNGLRVVVVESHALPLVAVRAVVGVDSLEDPSGKQGLYDITADMLREGTASMSAEQIADSVASLGNDVAPFRFTTITPNFGRSLALMAAMLARPAFPAGALERVKATLTTAEQRQLQSPATFPRRLLFEKLLGADHPIARSVVSAPSEIASITRDDIVQFYNSYFRPNNTTLVVVGDVQPARAIAAVRAAFGGWARGAVPRIHVPAPPRAAPTTIYLIDRPNAPQTLTFVGTLGPARTSRDYAALQALAPILGSAPASRIPLELRERHSYYYSGTPFAIAWRPAPLPSMLYGSVPIYAAKTDSALVAWIDELRGARTRPPTEQEMIRARGFLIGTLPEQIETDDGVADRVAFLAQNHLPADFYDTYARSVAAVTPKDVAAAATRYVDPEHLVIVMAGDRKLLEPRLNALKIGPVVIVEDK